MTKHETINAAYAAPIELKDAGEDSSDIVTKALETLQKSVEDRMSSVEQKSADGAKLTARLDDLEARINRPAIHTKGSEPSAERKAFTAFLRNEAIDTKTLRVADNAQGGFLAPAEFTSEFIRDLVQFSPIRALASVRTTGAGSVVLPKRTAITNARWTGETQASTGSEPSFAQIEVPVRELTTFVDVSNQLLADAGADVEGEIRLALAEDFGEKEAVAFVKGDGVLQPRGLMIHPDVAFATTATSATIKGDDLIDLFYSVLSPYRGRGTWLMNSGTLSNIRKLKDSAGQYLWQPALAAGQPETILGRPVVEALDMDATASNSFPVLFGDIGTAYRILDRITLSVLPDPYTQRTNGITRFHATRRVGADVIQPAAVKKLKVA